MQNLNNVQYNTTNILEVKHLNKESNIFIKFTCTYKILLFYNFVYTDIL